jgi:hypothetical protein
VHILAAMSIVCGAWFQPIPGWLQPQSAAATLDQGRGAQIESWVATFRVSPQYGISRRFPSDGIYISVNLVRPPAFGTAWRVSTVQLPLRLRNAEKNLPFEDPKFKMYRFIGRYRRQYNVHVQVIVRHPMRSVLARAEAELGRLVLPRWVPVASRCHG